MAKLGVIGIGNTLKGDDGVGVMLVNRLEEEDFSDEVEFHEVGTSGLNIIHYLKDLDKAVIIDALRSEGEPGNSTFFRPNEVDNSIKIRSTHDANLLEAIDLSETLGERPEDIVIMGIIPEDISLRDELSPLLKEKLPELEEKLKGKINSLLEEEGGGFPSS
ncbi:hydrogenase maturation protease [Candidatus Bipolaricaulota bacterium]|nr:hydrogenase maturation protease [Candidatus Bipolaricaulota bacterium]